MGEIENILTKEVEKLLKIDVAKAKRIEKFQEENSEKLDDVILAHILNLKNLIDYTPFDEIRDIVSEEEVIYSIKFLAKKSIELNKLQESFSLKQSVNYFSLIGQQLDTITTEHYSGDFFELFGTTIAHTKDVVQLLLSFLTTFYIEYIDYDKEKLIELEAIISEIL